VRFEVDDVWAKGTSPSELVESIADGEVGEVFPPSLADALLKVIVLMPKSKRWYRIICDS